METTEVIMNPMIALNTTPKRLLSVLDDESYRTLQAASIRLRASPDCHSLLKQYLTPDCLSRLSSVVTESGASIHDIIRSGLVNQDSAIGIYASEAEAYTLFAELFNPIIHRYHDAFKQPPVDLRFITTSVKKDVGDLDILSTRVRLCRNLEGFPFHPRMSKQQYLQIEACVRCALQSLDGELTGSYHSFSTISEEDRCVLQENKVLFGPNDRFLESAGAYRHWPVGRGVFLSHDKSFIVLVNEEDHLRIISLQSGGDLSAVCRRMFKALEHINSKLAFARSKQLGFLTFCPTNIGTTLRVSIHVRLPKLSSHPSVFDETMARLQLQVRGTGGEHTGIVDGVFDISNKRRMGWTEHDILKHFQTGIRALITLEKAM